MFQFKVLFALFLSFSSFGATPVVVQESYCTSSREFITTMEFLRTEKTLAVPEKEARKAAILVAGGCTGAARRFVHVTRSLVATGLSGSDALKMGIQFSSKTDAEADTFVAIFQKSFLREYLDLDLQSAMKMAIAIVEDYQLSAIEAREDYEKIVSFCVKAKGLDLPRPQCGTLAGKIAKLGDSYGGGIATPFIKLLEFLRSSRGANRPTGEALQLAETIIAAGPVSSENFMRGYQYAYAKNGLGYSAQAALNFAKDMALKTLFERKHSPPIK